MKNSGELVYDSCGSGPVVVLLHGFPLCRRMWRPQLSFLAEAGYQALAPDLRGFGESVLPSETMGMAEYADDVVALLDRLEIARAVVVGMSMGGYVLLDLLQRHRKRLAAAVFVVTRAGGDDAAAKEKRTQLADAVKGGATEVLTASFEDLLFSPDTLTRHPQLVEEVRAWMRMTSSQGLVAGLLAMRDRQDYRRRLASFDLPALVIGAGQDRAIPVAESIELDEMLPNSTLCLIPEGGHMVNLEQAERFNACLLAFLDRLRGGPKREIWKEDAAS